MVRFVIHTIQHLPYVYGTSFFIYYCFFIFFLHWFMHFDISKANKTTEKNTWVLLIALDWFDYYRFLFSIRSPKFLDFIDATFMFLFILNGLLRNSKTLKSLFSVWNVSMAFEAPFWNQMPFASRLSTCSTTLQHT